MKQITVKNLVLRFDEAEVSGSTKEKKARNAVELINLALQGEPYALGAQLDDSAVTTHDIEVTEVPE